MTPLTHLVYVISEDKRVFIGVAIVGGLAWNVDWRLRTRLA